uniref:Coenzyme Q-binding protein COQ10 START domain-containing protein n=1 Tax=Trieres chinensis TaxID=1514140 RepID=A0A7S2A9G1_TRICV|mmetsp:Transcript_8303/g.17595  ORF Transcript_8303/g.17595 Transcript_8303/m.17595 type:complete len:194 (+) Transcript_8303:84-665(+)
MWQWLEDRLNFAVGAYRDVDAPCHTVWDIVKDPGAYPSYFSGVTGVEFLGESKRGSHLRLGTKFRVHRRLPTGEVFHGDWTVSAIDTGPSFPKSVVFWSPHFANVMAGTTTWKVEPSEEGNKDRCRFSITLAISPQGLFTDVGRLMFCCCFQRKAMVAVEKDVDDVATAAFESIEVCSTGKISNIDAALNPAS